MQRNFGTRLAALLAALTLHCSSDATGPMGGEDHPAWSDSSGAPGQPSVSGGMTPSGGTEPGAGGGEPAAGGGSPGTGGGQPGREGYLNLAPPPGAPLDPQGGLPLEPPPPPGWTFHPIDGAMCRDGSPMGIFVRFAPSDKLLIYMEGGGACTSPGFCGFNPHNVDHVLSGDGDTVLGSAFGVVPGRQQPGAYTMGQLHGIFDANHPENPVRDWSMVYVPYCTGDVHFGSRPDGMVPGLGPQKFVGHLNMQKIVSRLIPTFSEGLSRIVVTGSSAGSFGAALNFSMIADAFPGVRADAILDSGAPFSDEYWPVCMQQRWRELWGLNDSMPPDCEQCFQADGGGMLGLADFLIEKHPESTIAAVTGLHDEVIRLFYAPGQDNCATFETADPVFITTGQILGAGIYPADAYGAALLDLRTRYDATGRLATYYLTGMNITLHQHLWRPRFHDPSAGAKTIGQFLAGFLNGQIEHIGP